MEGVEITSLGLACPQGMLAELREFYVDRLGLQSEEQESAGFGLTVGHARLAFADATAELDPVLNPATGSGSIPRS